MKNLKRNFYVEVKKRYRIHPTEILILRRRDEPKSSRTENQVQDSTEIRKNQKKGHQK